MRESEKISVSIIIPIFNAEEFLEETIQSVLNQSIEEIEIILVNDGSVDKSEKICNDYVNKNNRIKLISQKNSGVSVARNNGLSLAKGEYVFFMDSDDTIEKNFIKSSFEIAKQNDSDVVILGKYFCKRIGFVLALPTWAQLIRLDFLNSYKEIRFAKDIQPCEDGLFSHQLLSLTSKIAYNPCAEYFYRLHQNQNLSKINDNSWKLLNMIPKCLDILEDFYLKYDLYKTNSLQLARFIEHEPFEFRYLGMILNLEQKIFLHDLIKKFMLKNVIPFIKTDELNSLSKRFLYFYNSDSFIDFDIFFHKRSKFIKFKKKIYYVFINLIPNKKKRMKYRQMLDDLK